MNKLLIKTTLGLLLMICLTVPNVNTINVKERTDSKSEIKITPKHKYVGDPMLMQASEPAHLMHQKDTSI